MEKAGSPQQVIIQAIEESIQSKQKLLSFVGLFTDIANQWIDALRNGGTLFFFGNGGSASDAQHIAAELVGRFVRNRKSLPALALTVNSSNLTAIANDFGYERIFSRQLEAFLKKEDLVVAISTSGDSPNVLEGVKTAQARGCRTVGFTGEKGGKLKAAADTCFCAPASKTARIQEMHILVGHILCEIVEAAFL